MINVTLIPVLKDNYAYLLEAENGETAIVDPGEAKPVIEVLNEKDLKLNYIINTHHHGDHIAGNTELKEKCGAKLVGPAYEEQRIPGMDIMLREGDGFHFGGETAEIFHTPGHTSGHICLYFPDSKIVFTGDVIFSLGCGRLFEGTPEEMWNSFQKIMALPDETKLYCGHEYTVSNTDFCLHIEPDNQALKQHADEARSLTKDGRPTLPSTIGQEKETNVFLRAGSAERFAEIRKMKDEF